MFIAPDSRNCLNMIRPPQASPVASLTFPTSFFILAKPITSSGLVGSSTKNKLNFLYALICLIDCSTFHCWFASTIIKQSSPIVFLINSSLFTSASRSKPTLILKCFQPFAIYSLHN